MSNCSKINNTTIKGTSAVSYDSTPLPCTDVNTCDGLNTILSKFDAIICSVKANVDNITEDVINLTEDIMIITEDIININNQLDICCPNCDFTGTADQLPDPTTTTTTSSSSSTTTTTTSTSSSTTTTTTTVLDCSFTGTADEIPSSTTTTTSSSSTSTSTTTSTTTPVPTNPLSATWDLDSVNGNVSITSINNLNGEPISCINTIDCGFPIISGGGQYIAIPPTSDGITPINSPIDATLVLNLSWIAVIPGAVYYFDISVTGQPTVSQYVTYGTPVVALNVPGLITGSENVTILFTGTI